MRKLSPMPLPLRQIVLLGARAAWGPAAEAVYPKVGREPRMSRVLEVLRVTCGLPLAPTWTSQSAIIISMGNGTSIENRNANVVGCVSQMGRLGTKAMSKVAVRSIVIIAEIISVVSVI